MMVLLSLLGSLRGSRRRLLPVLVAAFAVHNIGYIWTSKRQQFLQRAEPIEAVVTQAQTNPLRPVRLACFPGNMGELERALRFRLGEPTAVVNVDANEPAALSFCGVTAHR